MQNKRYPEGIDLCWIASDQTGLVAAFITGGCGPIPFTALNWEGFDSTPIQDEILATPRKHVRQLAANDSFHELSERGFFVFDWKDVTRIRKNHSNRYELCHKPTPASTVSELAPVLAEIASQTRLALDFRSLDSIDISNLVDCGFPESNINR